MAMGWAAAFVAGVTERPTEEGSKQVPKGRAAVSLPPSLPPSSANDRTETGAATEAVARQSRGRRRIAQRVLLEGLAQVELLELVEELLQLLVVEERSPRKPTRHDHRHFPIFGGAPTQRGGRDNVDAPRLLFRLGEHFSVGHHLVNAALSRCTPTHQMLPGVPAL